MGTNPYGVMIVSGPEGFIKAAYRKFGIRGAIAPGDDFAMMKEVLTRRFSRGLKEQDADGGVQHTLGESIVKAGGEQRRPHP